MIKHCAEGSIKFDSPWIIPCLPLTPLPTYTVEPKVVANFELICDKTASDEEGGLRH